MGSCISSIGTANPANKVAQHDSYEFMVDVFGLPEEQAARLKAIYDHSGIQYRYSVVDDFGADRADYTFFEPTPDLEPFVTTNKRLLYYQEKAIHIALKAAQNCLSDYEGITSQITNLITVSCTGMYAPGIDIDLVEKLGLPHSTERTCINFMGCYGAINALKVADYICRANPQAKVLIVSVELCSLHFQKVNTINNWVANSLFADGAGAVLVENTATKINAKPALELLGFYAEIIPDSQNEMGWLIGNTGFEMTLTTKVPKEILKNIKGLAGRLLGKAGLCFEQVGKFAIHPGGRKILEAIEQGLEISHEANAYAYEVLNNYGNMSSATILFVLQRLMQDDEAVGHNVLSFGFGPGLTVEGMVLKLH
ncbi:type III polyketide synthase [Mucilaginibacter sp. PAMB04274]|uniref:type III polyketide synthase n=1 Tax=Mucilaginibacter sp. PAMB04274 TaxID=3138568 RepID=UPI0031F6D0B8